MKRIVSGIMLMLLLINVLTLAFSIQPVEMERPALTFSEEPSTLQETTNLVSEPPPTEWDKTYGGVGDDEAYCVVQTSEGGYAIAGRTNSSGAGGYDFWLVRTDASGNMLWSKTYGGTDNESPSALVQTFDGGYAMAGVTSSYNPYNWTGESDVLLVKTDANGNLQWNKTYEGTEGGDLDSASALVQTFDGGYAMAGYIYSWGLNESAWLFKTDASGNLMWGKTYGTGDESPCAMVQTSDGGYAMAGSKSYGIISEDFWLAKTDASGNMMWNKTYGETGGHTRAMVQTSDGGYALASSGCLLKTDGDGNEQWRKTCGGFGSVRSALVQTFDGGYAVAGEEWSWSAENYDFWLAKTDASGNMMWNKTYGGVGDDEAYSVVQTFDGGYAIAGKTNSFGAGDHDFWLVKLSGVCVKKPIVVLLHGFQSGEYNPDDIWSDMTNGLSDSYTVYVSHYAYDVVTALSIKEYAGNLQREIEQIMQKEGVDKVDIVAHSMGGLVARWHIEMGNGDKNVRKLIMLETPNQGCNKVLLPLALADVDPRVDELLNGLKFATAGMPLPPEAKWAFFLGSLSVQYSSYLGTALGMWMYWAPVKEMSSNSKFLKTLNSNYALKFKNKVDYTSLGGWLYEIPWLKAFDLEGIPKETVILDPIAGFHKNLPKNPEIIQRIKQILQSNVLNFAEMHALENNVESDTETQWTFPIVGEISQCEERSHEMPIGSAAAANFMLAWSGGDLNLTLTTPSGTLIDPSFAGNCSEVSYYGSENLTIKGYIIANPEIGVWNASVTAVDISENQNYMLVAMLNTNITLSIPLSKYQYDPQESINIAAILSFGNEAILNASVVAKIQRPDIGIECITLFDDGLHDDNLANDGIYASMYTNSSLLGTYEITVTANGTIDSGQFTRESSSIIWVDQYPDLAIDEQGISLSEEIPLEGQTITVNAAIYNLGQADAVNASILFYTGSPREGTLIGECTINVTASEVETASTQWNATFGAHEIYVLIYPYNQFLEENYTNNMAFKSIYIFCHDIAIQDLSLYKTTIGESFFMNMTAFIKNQGDFVEYFNITLYVNMTSIGTQTITLASGNSTIITFTWNTTGFVKGNYTISANITQVLGETDTTDNTLIDGVVLVGVPCDITGPTQGVPDGVCNMRDLGYICSKFGTTPSSAGWDSNCDVTGPIARVPDGIVNMRDIGEACSNFMKT